MAVTQIDHYVCDITYQENDMGVGGGPPPNWFTLNGVVYAPMAQLIMARRILNAFAQTPPALLTPADVIAPASAAELASVGLPVPAGVV